jgi:hypothetical protein
MKTYILLTGEGYATIQFTPDNWHTTQSLDDPSLYTFEADSLEAAIESFGEFLGGISYRLGGRDFFQDKKNNTFTVLDLAKEIAREAEGEAIGSEAEADEPVIATIDQTRAESLNFYVPPICQGQMVEYAYAVDGDRADRGYNDYIIRRRREHGEPDIYERFIDPEHEKEGRNLDFWDLEPDLGDLTDEWTASS